MSTTTGQQCTALHCTVAEHMRCESIAYAAGREQGDREGFTRGHRVGQAEGHLAGFAEGVRSTTAYRVAAADEWRSGYVSALGDLRAGKAVSA